MWRTPWHWAQMDQSIGPMIVWSLVLIGVLVALFTLVMKIRRWSHQSTQAPTGQGFNLSDLRAMHKRGQISDEEFDRARARLASSARARILGPSDHKDEPPSVQ